MRKQMKIFCQVHHVTQLAVNAKFLQSCQNMLRLSIVEGKRDTPAHSLVGFRSHVVQNTLHKQRDGLSLKLRVYRVCVDDSMCLNP